MLESGFGRCWGIEPALRLERLEQVTHGAINGLAVGGAVSIAASFDFAWPLNRPGSRCRKWTATSQSPGMHLPRLMREIGPSPN